MKNLFASVLLLTGSIAAQDAIYKSDSFTLYPDRVTQGKYEGRAVSNKEIHSTYKSPFKRLTPNFVNMKFSINGLDNERPAGQDHSFYFTPTDGKDTVDFVFAVADAPMEAPSSSGGTLSEETDLLVRVDMRGVIREFRENGFYTTFDGHRISREEFQGLYAAGSAQPLTWEFSSLKNRDDLKLSDNDNDGIYEGWLHFKRYSFPGQNGKEVNTWQLSSPVSSFASYSSPSLLADALYNMSLEEMQKNIRPDGAFMAGAMWEGVWTRDVSYSIILSLACVAPDASKATLLAKVKNKRIIQDTGTGGAWPASSDRMVWALAAWEVYRVTGDRQWLKDSYEIIRNSAEDDLKTLYDESTGLFGGESSFLDWREQTYPRWMEPKDIFVSKNLGTNAVHYQAYTILSEMAALLGEDASRYRAVAERIKDGMNKYLWMKDKGYYGQYLYGRNHLCLSPRAEALGEALSVIYGIASDAQAEEIISKTPVMQFGTPCIYPQIPGLPPYHNDAIWPFVETFRALAAARTGSTKAVEHSIAAIYRAAALFLTNKENMVASTGDFLGTEINSDRQLWSLAGNLAIVYRLMFGMNFEENGLSFSPFIPKAFGGMRKLENFRYRGAVLNISVSGFGSRISSISLDGKRLSDAVIPAGLKGKHEIVIVMDGMLPEEHPVAFAGARVSPETPSARIVGNTLMWNTVEGAAKYMVFINGRLTAETAENSFILDGTDGYQELQVLAADKDGYESFLSEPVILADERVLQAEGSKAENKTEGFKGTGYVTADKAAETEFTLDIPEDGSYAIDFRYANGNGPINTDNKCAIRTLYIDGQMQMQAVVLPQRGDGKWDSWGYSNSLKVNLRQGSHRVVLKFEPHNNNMNGDVNTALIDLMRVRRL